MKSRIFETACSEQKVILPTVLFCLLVANVLFCMGGFSFTLEPLNNMRILTGYLLPMGLFLSLRNTPAFRFKKVATVISLSIAILSLLGLAYALWGGELNFRRSITNEQPGTSFRSDINTWHTIMQKENTDGLTITLDSQVEKGVEDRRIIELMYDRTILGFLRQTKPVCKVKGGKDASFSVNKNEKTIKIKATSASNDNQVEQSFSLDFDAVKPKPLHKVHPRNRRASKRLLRAQFLLAGEKSYWCLVCLRASHRSGRKSSRSRIFAFGKRVRTSLRYSKELIFSLSQV